MTVTKCSWCETPTTDVIELGRSTHLIEIPCCPGCFEEINKLSQERKDEMAEYAFISG